MQTNLAPDDRVDTPTSPLSPHHSVAMAWQPLRFDLPKELEASEPPEARGLTRDAVRMMVAHRGDGNILHTTFTELPRFLREEDAIVINTSGTLAAAVAGTDDDDRSLEVHLSTELPAGLWTVELRLGDEPWLKAKTGQVIRIEGGGKVFLLKPYARDHRGVRLWVTTIETPGALLTYLTQWGRPISYGYVHNRWPITVYQNVYATEAGSAEMPSAGRPFTHEVLTRLVARGVSVIPVLLHTGVASLEAWEPPYPEYFRVGSLAAERLNAIHRDGGRIIAIGTTAVRAVESVVDERGHIHGGQGWTESVITPEHPPGAIDGLLTGWHEPAASHLSLLEAIAGRDLVERSYEAALDNEYLWHEFGDVHLVLP